MIGGQLLSWVCENTVAITSLVSIITVGIWGFYAHLLYRDYRNRNHPRILIQQLPGSKVNSLCMITNMSEKILNVPCIFVVGYGENGNVYKKRITDYDQFSSDLQTGQIMTTEKLQQNTLSPGDLICLGRFSFLLKKLGNSEDDPICALEVRVVAFFGARDDPIGAYRLFSVNSGQDELTTQINPSDLKTEQMTSFLQKRLVKKWTYDCLNGDFD